VEPDECYLVGDQSRDTPDLAIEVIWTSGGLDKLEIYRRLGVGEVWIWKEEKIQMHVLRGEEYQLTEKSRLSPTWTSRSLPRFWIVLPRSRR
jgi:Uma2 family endonuclease